MGLHGAGSGMSIALHANHHVLLDLMMHGSQHCTAAIMQPPLQRLHLDYPPGQPSVQLGPYMLLPTTHCSTSSYPSTTSALRPLASGTMSFTMDAPMALMTTSMPCGHAEACRLMHLSQRPGMHGA